MAFLIPGLSCLQSPITLQQQNLTIPSYILMRTLLHTSDVYDPKENKFLHTIIFWKEGENFYRSELSEKTLKEEIALDDIPLPPKPLDMTLMNGIWKPGLLEFDISQEPNPNKFHIKSPSLLDYGTGFPTGQLLINEATVLQKLRSFGGHPNICEYYGCIRSGQYVTGLVLKKYKKNLQEALSQAELSSEQRRAIFAGIEEGLSHLHGHSFVHNDIRPENIMLDENGVPKMSDFDSCFIIGDKSVPFIMSGCLNYSIGLDAMELHSEKAFLNDSYSMDLIHNLLFPTCPSLTAGADHSKVLCPYIYYFRLSALKLNIF